MRRWRCLCVLCVIAVSGCAQPTFDLLTPPEPPVVWPESPDPARVRYVGELKGSDDLPRRKTLSESWNELLYGPGKPSRLVTPHAVAVHAVKDRVAVADTNAKCVHVFDLDRRKYVRHDGWGEAGKAFECPVGVAWVGDDLWVADSKLHALAVLGAWGGGRLIAQDELKRPAGMAFCPADQLCYVCDAAAHVVLAFDTSGKCVKRLGSRGAGPAQFNYPSYIACGPGGVDGPAAVLVVVDTLNFRVQRLGLDGTALSVFGRKGDAAGDLALPKAAGVDSNGNVWVVDAHFENVQAFASNGTLLMAFGREGRERGEFWLPAGICIDAKRRMWIADTYNRRVQVFELLP
jgi:sugar lactone lactonase YvrE